MHRRLLQAAGLWDTTPSVMGRPGLCTIDDEEFVDSDEDYSAGAGSNNGEEDEGPKHRFTSHEEAERGYRELQSTRLKDVNEFRQWKSSIEQELQALRGANQEEEIRNDLRTRGLSVAEKVVERIKKANLDKEDPEYHKKYFGELITTILEENSRDRQELPKAMQDIARNTVSAEEQARIQQAEARKVATAQAVKELKAYGMSEDDLQEIIDKRDAWNHRNPKWTEEVPVEKQIPMLVEEVARRRGLQRQEAQDENAQVSRNGNYPSLHPRSAEEASKREAARLEQKRRAGGMNGGANVNSRGGTGNSKGGDLGSFVGDMRNLKFRQREKSATIANRN